MSEATDLLDQASSVLARPAAYSNRAACWIARAALECAVDSLLTARGRTAPGATMRSKLSVLQVAYHNDADREAPSHADYAWARLSQVCHHHAFELSPTASEVHHLIDLVRSLVGLADDADPRTPPSCGVAASPRSL